VAIAVSAVGSGKVISMGHEVIDRRIIRGFQAVSAVHPSVVMVVTALELKLTIFLAVAMPTVHACYKTIMRTVEV